MSIEENFFNKMSITNLDNIHTVDFVMNLDILSGCVHSCSGCFVNKRPNVDKLEETLERAYALAKDLSDKGLRFREVVLGPTDFFSASNTVEILKNPFFQKLMSLHKKTRITTACIFENLNRDRFKEIFSVLENPNYFRKKLILEFLTPLNSEKIINKDQVYIEENKWALEYFENQTEKVVDWSYVVNIHNNNGRLKDNYIDVVNLIKKEFNTILEFNPGFFRVDNESVINQNLSYWKDFLQDILTKNNPQDILVTNLDHHHNTENVIWLNFYKDEVYFSPFIYEQIIDTHETFKVEDMSAAAIIQKHVDLQVKGFEYVASTESCSDCSYLTACVGRNVLNVMENKSIKTCLFPDKFREIDAMVEKPLSL